MIAPEKITTDGDTLIFEILFVKALMVTMNRIAATANIGLQISDTGKILTSSGTELLVSRIDDLLKILSVTALAV